jgi:hypothetical protein
VIDENLEIDPAAERALPITGLPIASADFDHHLCAAAFEVCEAILRSLVRNPETEQVAPEMETIGQVPDGEFGYQRREAASRPLFGIIDHPDHRLASSKNGLTRTSVGRMSDA